ncbi:MAG: PhzF family phenazine biosynthesis protein [Sphingomonas sp.]|uniref:PhzF family phenazine biosynthesis protein n=1 Tax=Sphingomonas sp. TaxID=28214 RepID=UPI003567E7DB
MMPDFQLVDVFGQGRFSGNPLAVISGGDDLDSEQMMAITRWLNLSETSFLLPPTEPGADYRVRIFTLERELPFAGHPTLGSCHAWLANGGVARGGDTIVQQCGAGLIPIRRADERLAFAAPPLLRSGPVDEADLKHVIEVLGITRDAVVDAAWADNGPGWIAVMLSSAEDVLALQPRLPRPERVEIGVVGPHPAGSDTAFEIRAFFSDQHGTLIEDPVTGSLNASVAQWLFASGRARGGYIAAQGTKLGRTGRVHVEQDGDTVWIGGATQTLFEGKMG